MVLLGGSLWPVEVGGESAAEVVEDVEHEVAVDLDEVDLVPVRVGGVGRLDESGGGLQGNSPDFEKTDIQQFGGVSYRVDGRGGDAVEEQGQVEHPRLPQDLEQEVLGHLAGLVGAVQRRRVVIVARLLVELQLRGRGGGWLQVVVVLVVVGLLHEEEEHQAEDADGAGEDEGGHAGNLGGKAKLASLLRYFKLYSYLHVHVHAEDDDVDQDRDDASDADAVLNVADVAGRELAQVGAADTENH